MEAGRGGRSAPRAALTALSFVTIAASWVWFAVSDLRSPATWAGSAWLVMVALGSGAAAAVVAVLVPGTRRWMWAAVVALVLAVVSWLAIFAMWPEV